MILQTTDDWFVSLRRYTMLKEQMNGGDKSIKLTPGQHLLASAQSGMLHLLCHSSTSPADRRIVFINHRRYYSSILLPSRATLEPLTDSLCVSSAGAITAVMTNPIWVVKTRMFTTRVDDKRAYRNAFGAYSYFRLSTPPSDSLHSFQMD